MKNWRVEKGLVNTFDWNIKNGQALQQYNKRDNANSNFFINNMTYCEYFNTQCLSAVHDLCYSPSLEFFALEFDSTILQPKTHIK